MHPRHVSAMANIHARQMLLASRSFLVPRYVNHHATVEIVHMPNRFVSELDRNHPKKGQGKQGQTPQPR